MTIWTFTICRNCADVLGFYLRHYGAFADNMWFWDDGSTDGTLDMLKDHPKVLVSRWPLNTGIDEDAFLGFAYHLYPMAMGRADWVMWVDPDEFIYHPDLIALLTKAKSDGFEVVQPDGFNMMHEGMPKDDGVHQIWELCKTGVHAPVYSKPVIFQPQIHIQWDRGKHHLENCNPRVWHDSGVKLLHYRYLGYEYTKHKNAVNYSRLPGDKAAGWTCKPDWHGEHSPEWAVEAMKEAKEVI